MTHITKDMLRSYIEGETEYAEHIDQHLLECDECVALYMSVLDDIEMNSTLSSDFTDKTIQQIEKTTVTPKRNKKNHLLVHYLVAAGLTMLLTVSGVFQGVTNMSDMKLDNDGSFTDELMTKTLDLLDNIKGESHNE
ncbi:hypothetical protein SH601_09415 [Gracilibacillus sp. S3-1-1]|uniref:Uncharacterized protein n=1 Tax=Gracilibacillus pellucidus TaxID=3095368 RepID=A0ACC6M5L5_9BACI|nr:hypothetical protein [Gracilibacillus sp. S3-1-1]MDX8046208.1 hypothetical protein [Gracilibacillus sp. S3-1-1]